MNQPLLVQNWTNMKTNLDAMALNYVDFSIKFNPTLSNVHLDILRMFLCRGKSLIEKVFVLLWGLVHVGTAKQIHATLRSPY